MQQTLEQGFNIARNAALLAEIPHSVPANTVNRLCGSSMQVPHDATRMIMTGDASVCLIGASSATAMCHRAMASISSALAAPWQRRQG
ncbi:hypothetical protein MJ575_01780 [Klebsiella pneumoniae]|nr:hypothetical protein MJ575_01780 [Klebsiella pneumoniae]